MNLTFKIYAVKGKKFKLLSANFEIKSTHFLPKVNCKINNNIYIIFLPVNKELITFV